MRSPEMTRDEYAALVAAGKAALETISPRHPLRALLASAVAKATKPGVILDTKA